MSKLRKGKEKTEINPIEETWTNQIQIRLPLGMPGAFFHDTGQRAILQNMILEYILLNCDPITRKKLKRIDVIEFEVKYCDETEMKTIIRPWHLEAEFNGISYVINFKQRIIIEFGKDEERIIQL